MSEKTLCERLGGYDAILSASAGGPVYYTERDMKSSHQGTRISENDWSAFPDHLDATLDAFRVPAHERDQVVGFIKSTRSELVEA